MEGFVLKMKGEYWDEVYELCPHTNISKLVKVTDKLQNTVVASAKELVAALLANETNMVGIFYHAFGRGDVAWDTSPIPAVPPASTQLLDEIGRIPVDSIVFLDGGDNPLPAGQRSLVLRIKTVMDYSDFNGDTIREHALFGGDATAIVNSGIMVNTLRTVGQFKGNVRVVKLVKLTIL